MNKCFWFIPPAIGLGIAIIFWSLTHEKEKSTMHEPQNHLPATAKALVVYYSHSGNTKAIAETIQSKTDADLFQIEVETPYPADYNTLTSQAKEELAKGYLPPIKGKVENLADYDLVFIGSPNWWSTIAPPVMTFLANHDLKGKTVIPFITHGGGGVAACVTDLRKQAPGAVFGEAFVVHGNRAKESEENITSWLKMILKEKNTHE